MRRLVWTLYLLQLMGCNDESASSAGVDAGQDMEQTDQPEADAGGEAAEVDTTVVPSTGCDGAAFQAGFNDVVELEHDGMTRSYILSVPEGLDTASPVPLVLNFHGLNSNATQQRVFSAMNRTAESEGFIVAYPEGLLKSWNARSCCAQYTVPMNDADDAGFARALVAELTSKLCVDERRIYATGMSNGGYMSEHMACVNADLFAAVAPVSALEEKHPDCEPSRPIPLIAFNGTADETVGYEGSTSTIADWVERLHCDAEPTREGVGETSYCETWSGCDAGTEVIHCTSPGMGHCWPGQALCPFGDTDLDISANERMWAFFERYRLPL